MRRAPRGRPWCADAAWECIEALLPLPRGGAARAAGDRGHCKRVPATRAFASEEPSRRPPLKQRLRELYKRVHPDMFSRLPKARDTNAASFAELQAYLTGGGPRGRPKPTPLPFYVAKERAVATASNEGTGSLTVERIEAVLPPLPPCAHGGGSGDRESADGSSLPASALVALSKLLEAAGVSGEFAQPTRQAGATPAEDMVALLRLLVEETHKAPFDMDAVKRPVSDTSAAAEAAALARAAQRRRGVAVHYSAVLCSHQRQLAARRLAKSLDAAAGVQLEGLRLMIGTRASNGLDAHGNLWLDVDAGGGPQRWADALLALDEAHILQAQGSAALRVAEEQEAAARLKVDMVYAGAEVRSSDAYGVLLQELSASGAPSGGALANGELEKLAVCVVDDLVGLGECWRVDDDLGYVTVPLRASPAEVVAFLERRGCEAVAARAARADRESTKARLAAHVSQKLRTRAVTVDGGLHDDEATRALSRLMRHAHLLGPLLQGVAVHVGHETRARGGVLELAHDFSLEL